MQAFKSEVYLCTICIGAVCDGGWPDLSVGTIHIREQGWLRGVRGHAARTPGGPGVHYNLR